MEIPKITKRNISLVESEAARCRAQWRYMSTFSTEKAIVEGWREVADALDLAAICMCEKMEAQKVCK